MPAIAYYFDVRLESAEALLEPPALAFGSRSSVFKERPGTHHMVLVPGAPGLPSRRFRHRSADFPGPAARARHAARCSGKFMVAGARPSVNRGPCLDRAEPQPGQTRRRGSPVRRHPAPSGLPTAYRDSVPRRGDPRAPTAPGALGGHPDADPRRRTPGARAGPSRRRPERCPVPGHQVGAVEVPGDPQGLAELGRAVARSRSRRAAGRAAHIASSPASGASARSSTARAVPSVPADHVGAPVHAVGEVHVQPPRRPEHGGVAARSGPGRRGRPGRRSPR